jgi:sulfite reductase beta subunit-like hemoprotein
MKKEFAPNFRTAEADYSKEERNKLSSNSMRGSLAEELRSDGREDLSWEAEQIAKSYGIYLEFNRAKTGSEKDWMYMIRVTIPGGGPLTPAVWTAIDEIAERYTTTPEGNCPSIRLTTRQNVQFHWIKKHNVATVVRLLAQSGLSTLNGCGDNVRNVMACPLAAFSDVFNANAWAKQIAAHFELPQEPFIQIFEIDRSYMRSDADEEKKFTYGKTLLNRKFKIAIGSVHRDECSGALVPDNCVELRTHDLSAAPVFEGNTLKGFQIYIGGGQGERNGKPTLAALAQPFAFVAEKDLLNVLSAVVQVHQDWGDRQNRHWARIKYVVKKMGVQWFRDQVRAIVGFELAPPLDDHDIGDRQLHHGWTKQPDGLYAFGAFVENGRVSDAGVNGRLKTAIRAVSTQYDLPVVITPNQDLLFINVSAEDKGKLLADLESYGFGLRSGKRYSTLRTRSGACVGRDTCRLAYTDSEKFEPELIDALEERGWGDLKTSIGVTGCERQCFRPATKAIGLIGTGLNLYQLKLMGTEDGRHQGQPLSSENGSTTYLRMIPREEVVNVIDTLFKLHEQARLDADEEPGYCFRRLGADAVIAFLKENPQTTHLMEKVYA